MATSIQQSYVTLEAGEEATVLGGYVATFVEDIDDEFKCIVCLEVLRDPRQIIPCGHRFCETCLAQLLRSSKSPVCPMDRNIISEEKTFPDNGYKRKILNFEVFCDLSVVGCTWKSTLSHLEAHLADDCLYVDVSCTNAGCSLKMERRFMEEHKNKLCEQRVVQCDLCLQENLAFQLQDHKEKDCKSFALACPNDGCSLKIKRCEMENHIKNACPFIPQDCPLEFLGCQVKGTGSYIDEHLTQEARSHLRLACDELKASRSELKASRSRHDEELKKLQMKIQQLEKKDTVSMQSLSAMKVEMQQLQLAVASMETKIQSKNDELKVSMNQVENQVQLIQEQIKHKVVSKIWVLREPSQWDHGEERFSSEYTTAAYRYRFQLYCRRNYEGVTICVQHVTGNSDEQLPWPFYCDATISILNVHDNRWERFGDVHFLLDEDPRHFLCEISTDDLELYESRHLNVKLKLELKIPYHHPAVN